MKLLVSLQKRDIMLKPKRSLFPRKHAMRFEWLALLAYARKTQGPDGEWVSIEEIQKLPLWRGKAKEHIGTNVGRYIQKIDKSRVKLVEAQTLWRGPYRLRLLPWEVFIAVWTALHLAAIAWLGPWTILIAYDDVIRGNVSTFFAVGVVLAVRGQAWTWAAVLLTKVTPGVGILYHVGRREWRAVVVALGTTLGLVALTWPLGLWPEWIASLRQAPDNYMTVDVLAPLPVRLAVGALLCVMAARWIWLLPVGMLVAMPGLWPSSLAILAAIPLLRRAGTDRVARSVG